MSCPFNPDHIHCSPDAPELSHDCYPLYNPSALIMCHRATSGCGYNLPCSTTLAPATPSTSPLGTGWWCGRRGPSRGARRCASTTWAGAHCLLWSSVSRRWRKATGSLVTAKGEPDTLPLTKVHLRHVVGIIIIDSNSQHTLTASPPHHTNFRCQLELQHFGLATWTQSTISSVAEGLSPALEAAVKARDFAVVDGAQGQLWGLLHELEDKAKKEGVIDRRHLSWLQVNCGRELC